MSDVVIASNKSISIGSFTPTYSASVGAGTQVNDFYTVAAGEYVDIYKASFSISLDGGGSIPSSSFVKIRVTYPNGIVEEYETPSFPTVSTYNYPALRIFPNGVLSVVDTFSGSTSYTVKFVGYRKINSP